MTNTIKPLNRSGQRPTVLYAAAAVGAVLVLFETYLIIAWISGPNFQEVTSGPSVPPLWMQVAVRGGEVVGTGIALAMLYRLVLTPWLRERRVPYDGLAALGALAVSVYDPLSAYFHPWFTYNAFFFNRGTPIVEVPGWQSYHAPGEQVLWAPFFFPAVYVVLFVVMAAFGCLVMRRAQARWPHLPGVALVGICFAVMFLFDASLEGPVLMRLGYWEHTGSSVPFLDGYHGHNAIKNMVFAAVIVTAAAALRFFKNDRGETLVERGASQLGSSGAKVTGLRLLAVVAALQVILLLGYHVPVAVSTLISPDNAWHPAMVDNSYLNDHICGYGTPRTCPRG
jgi:hypothetical protein